MTARILAISLVSILFVSDIPADDSVRIGSRRELFVDDALVASLENARRILHRPTPREVVLVHDEPWEGSGSGYHTVFRDGDRYRMYYKGWQLTVKDDILRPNPLVCCYAESRDGVRWTKPKLGLFEFNGSRENNIVLASGIFGALDVDAGHPAVFKDTNPGCRPSARYKAFFRSRSPNGLLAFQSSDGIHWKPVVERAVITKGAFDSQNLAFWDSARKEYRAYFRYFEDGRRDILTATSPDFVSWTDPVPLQYRGAPDEQLYTNQIKPYYRAPHLLIGFPTRYTDRGWSPSTEALPELAHRRLRAGANQRYGTAITEALLMSSRDGLTFDRWGEAFLRPGPERRGTWNYGHQYVAWHAVETESTTEGAPNELSLYASESYWTGSSCRVRRYTLRVDGFVSVRAPLVGGQLVTKPVVFDGNRLAINFSSSAAGGIRVALEDVSGEPFDGFSLSDCHEVFGDSLNRTVAWRGSGDVSGLAGKPVRLRFELKDADLYSFRFRTESSTTLSAPETPFEVVEAPSVTIRAGNLTAVLVDNRAFAPEHRAGYNGLASLSYDGGPSPFVPLYAGLNLEHVNNGKIYADRDLRFEPRRHAMELRKIDGTTYELYQAALPNTGLESCTRFAFRDRQAIDVTFECVPRLDKFPFDHLNIFWASYIHQPEDPAIYFLGRRKGERDQVWLRTISPSHGVHSTHRSATDVREFGHEDPFPLTLVFNESEYEYTSPFYYGRYKGAVWIVMFRRKDHVRLTQSPSGGGSGNPAWDFQWFIESPRKDVLSRLIFRAVYKKWEGRDDVIREYERFVYELDS